jgi:hypothetical protein
MQDDMKEFREQLRSGSIRRAYRALLDYMMNLRKHFQRRYSDYSVSGLYQGCMDMTFFALVPPFLKRRGLKVAIVFNYDAFRFEAWLAGRNRQVQREYWELFKDTRWGEYRVTRGGGTRSSSATRRGLHFRTCCRPPPSRKPRSLATWRDLAGQNRRSNRKRQCRPAPDWEIAGRQGRPINMLKARPHPPAPPRQNSPRRTPRRERGTSGGTPVRSTAANRAYHAGPR